MPCDNNESHKNLIIPRENQDNNESSTIPVDNNENHANHII